MLVAIVISLGVMGGINENKCDYNLQEATVAMTYAAGTGEYGPEASGKLAVGALAMGKVTEVNAQSFIVRPDGRVVVDHSSESWDSRSRSRSSRIIKK